MNKAKTYHYIWILALITGAIGVLGEYDLVIIKGISQHSFELLLAAFGLLIIARLFRK